MVELTVIIGAGRSSRELVRRLARMAPATLVDSSQVALDAAKAELTGGADDASAGKPITFSLGDGSSKLVLEDLRGRPDRPTALVVTPGEDRAAVEICRLGAELGYAPVVAIVAEARTAAACEKLGARPFVKADLIGLVVEQAIRQGGLGAGASIGFRGGELSEFRVLPSSPAIGIPLFRLSADRWRVAAIYRGDDLVLPTGVTTIEAEDRVLVVGDPRVLPHVTETLRVGLATFPLLHGPNVVVYLPSGRDPEIEAESEQLWLATRAARLVRLFPGGVPKSEAVDAPEVARPARRKAGPPQAADAVRKYREQAPLTGQSLAQHLECMKEKHAGVIVARPPRRGFFDVLLGRGGVAATLCNEAGVPILFPHGVATVSRVVLGVTEVAGDAVSADIALDLARLFNVPICLMRVRLPSYLGGDDDRIAKLIEVVMHRASLHEVSVELRELEGNPIREWVRATNDDDLFVIARAFGRRDSYSSPDVPLRMARASKCSVLVCTGHKP